MPLPAGRLQGKLAKRQKAYAARDAGGRIVGRFDKMIQDHRDDESGSALSQK